MQTQDYLSRKDASAYLLNRWCIKRSPGYLANLVVLSRDPTREIANMRSVVMTVKRGRRLDRENYVPITPEEVAE